MAIGGLIWLSDSKRILLAEYVIEWLHFNEWNYGEMGEDVFK